MAKLEPIIRKEASGKKLTANEAKQLAAYRRRNPVWSKVYASAVKT